MFDEVVRRQEPTRAARRAAWVAGSTVLHICLAAAVASASTALAVRRASERPIEVRFVRSPPPPLAREAPVVPPRPRRAESRPRSQPPPAPLPPAPVIQPRAVPAEMPRPAPAEPPEPGDDGADDGIVGGGPAGAAAEAVTAPQPRLDFDAATMTRPEFVSGPSPEYTRRALQREVEGLMTVRCVVTAEGEVRGCQVLQGLPDMDAAVVEALQRRRYRPARRNGTPVEVSYLFKLRLTLPR